MQLQDSLTVLKGVGPKSAEAYTKLGLFTLEDLLTYYPFRYEDFSQKSVADLGDEEKAVVTGRVVTPPQVQYYGRARNRLSFKIKQADLVINVSFFNQPYLQDKIQLDEEVAIFGKWQAAKASLVGMKVLAQVTDDMQPVYHLAKGISQQKLVGMIRTAFEAGYLALVPENLPSPLLERYRLVDRQTAIHDMHFPADQASYKAALRRVKFEELFYFQMQLAQLKGQEMAVPGIQENYDLEQLNAKKAQLPFALTAAQENSLSEILADMASFRHMNRLLQGDVGSGKTVVASLAMYASYTAGYQSALMVPTEILAEQHYESLQGLFPDLSIALLTSGMKTAVKKAALDAIASGQVDMIVGTHALIQEGVVYQRLGLVITDEQHRFGVKQRQAFREKGDNPDVLMMTATPIPRTLAITAFGEMDVSVIDQLPAGRKPIVTRWVKHQQLETVLDWVQGQVKEGAQVYVVSPLIEESEALDLKNAMALKEELSTYFGPSIRLDLMHGRMKNDEKEAVMTAFKAHELDVLVSTTVIEVGVNVPNASIMLIMDADRFGLSQLHQLRGRVGRGDKQSYAILVANPKTDSGKRRMQIMTETTNGFVLAEEDLKMRGTGEVFGVRQSGIPEFRTVDLVQDFAIVEEARKVAQEIAAIPDWQETAPWSLVTNFLSRPDHLD
ncbi:ATP-dependent DNA helicase RecG [Streptococcus sp. DD12]|uniref:ATP-dependent DNA helicase RecG n=1 Tax=Streptococcus sp. DD12 TaxID=1777880 RepID=UPI000792ED84|nr:ATP-dependent DNA helicase RecG [Streptococcus sp. DD12]KXT75819.1 ATP-dependent DNA helicase RecG [Streptococcus sp. DD12]